MHVSKTTKKIVEEINAILEIMELFCKYRYLLHLFPLPFYCDEMSSGNSALAHLDFLKTI